MKKFLVIVLVLGVLMVLAAASASAWGTYVDHETFPTTCLFGKEVAIFDYENNDTDDWTVHAHFFGPGGGDSGNYNLPAEGFRRIKWTATGIGKNITEGTADATPESGPTPSIYSTSNYCQ